MNFPSLICGHSRPLSDDGQSGHSCNLGDVTPPGGQEGGAEDHRSTHTTSDREGPTWALGRGASGDCYGATAGG